MWAFAILAVIFLVLWLIEKQKTKNYEDLKAARAAADIYANQKQAEADDYARQKMSEGDSLYEAKHREALDYYWKKTQSADDRVKKAGP